MDSDAPSMGLMALVFGCIAFLATVARSIGAWLQLDVLWVLWAIFVALLIFGFSSASWSRQSSLLEEIRDSLDRLERHR